MDLVNQYIQDLRDTLSDIFQDPIHDVIDILHTARIDDRQVFIMGNGGSASTATHFVCDLSKNTRMVGKPHFRVVGLTDNMALLSAYANDEGYDQVFVQQLASFVQPDDVVIGISTSGNSPNVLEAIDLANRINAITIGFTGFDKGRLGQMVDINLHVPSDNIEQVEDIHLMFEHLICTVLRQRIQFGAIKKGSLPSVNGRSNGTSAKQRVPENMRITQ
jgi:D-sedoheptulose 7-phosphate isomerase